MGSRGGEDTQQRSSWGNGLSHICVQINLETDGATQGSSAGEIKPQNL